MLALILQMQFQQELGTAASQIPGRLRGQAAQIDGVKIASRGKQIGTASGRGTGGSSCNTPTLHTGQEGLPFPLTALEQARY